MKNLEKENFDAKLSNLLENFSDLEEEGVNEIIKDNFSLDDIELKLYALRGKTQVNTPAGSIKTYPIWDSMVRTQENMPPWGDVVSKYRKSEN